ncbi:MAG: PAS domain-containing sensor histidine kinase [Candidatus Nanopelagicales bacterium]|nr:PAS domain-containing sensor histidine kinase [Candidatus Nanopelagicales bacterium]
MTEIPGPGRLPVLPEAEDERRSRHLSAVIIAAVFAAGMAAVMLTAWWSTDWPVPSAQYTAATIWPYIAFIAVATLAEIIYVPVRHGDGVEDLTFFEILVVGGVLVFLPVVALVCPLIGFAVAELLLGRPLRKVLFNTGSYALAASALILIYAGVAGTGSRFGASSVIALLLGTAVFVTINLVLLAWILNVAQGVPFKELIRDQWLLSASMAVGSVGVAATAVALAKYAPALTVFSLVPAAALWYAYRSSAAHTHALERNRWLVRLNSLVTTLTAPHILVPGAANAIRHVFGADTVRVVLPTVAYGTIDSQPQVILLDPSAGDDLAVTAASESVQQIPGGALPDGWVSGCLVRLDTGDDTPGVLMLGASRRIPGLQRLLPWAQGEWQLREVDAPVLQALAASTAGAIRASQHLTALVEETAKLNAVVDHATDGIAVMDATRAFVMWSPAMASITGVSAETALASVPPSGTDDPVAILARLAESASSSPDQASSLLTRITRDSEDRELQVWVVWIDHSAVDLAQEPESRRLAILTARDITQERRVERMKADFIATVSHELRTPITPIKGYAGLLADKWDRLAPEKRVDILNTIVDRADHLTRLVDDLLLASRASDTSARLTVEMTDEDLLEVVHEALKMFPDEADRVRVTGSGVTVSCDRVRAIQCMANLIGNALKYSQPGSAVGVEIRREEGGSWATVSVIDHGLGIRPDQLEKVFERFYRVEDPMTMTTGGSGVGLFVSRELARAMGGDIDVISQIGEGSTFTLRLRPADYEAGS